MAAGSDLTRLPEAVRALLDPSAHAVTPTSIRLGQTQISFVVIAGDYVYKVKKPVDLGFLDYSTLEKRRHLSRREVELNRRLCSETYLGVVPLVKAHGKVTVHGRGRVVEYAVKMKRLPEDRLMPALLADGSLTEEMVRKVARRVADFHARAETGASVNEFGSIANISHNNEENYDQTEKSIGRTISRAKYDRVRAFTRSFEHDNAALFEQRIADGRVRDCHGDLHAAHICFTDGICIFDCIEFSDRLRYGDVTIDVAFLAMDLDHYGRADLAQTFVNEYVVASGDRDLPRILKFYKCYRAYVRGKVESFKLDDPYIPPAEKEAARQTASGYFDLAAFYTRPRPVLFMMAGVTGTGKSWLAGALARRLGLVVISSDMVRKGLAGIPATEHRYDDFDRGIYSADFTQRTYATMVKRARDALRDGASVVLDATFIRRADRLQATALAAETGADFLAVECVVDEETNREWLALRMTTDTASDGRLEILGPQQAQFEPLTEIDESRKITVDSARPLDENVRAVMTKLGED